MVKFANVKILKKNGNPPYSWRYPTWSFVVNLGRSFERNLERELLEIFWEILMAKSDGDL